MSRIGIGVVGCGGIAGAHFRAIAATDPVQLVAVTDVVRERAEKAADEHGGAVHDSAEDLLADPAVDAVLLLLPHYLHCPLALQAVEAGKHVLVEKPMALNLAEAEQMVEAAERAGVQLMVGQSTRFRPVVWAAKAVIQEGRLGWVRQCIYRRVFMVERLSTPWRYLGEQCGGLYLPLFGSHDVDMLLWLMDGRPCRVQSVLRSWTTVAEAESDGAILIECEKGEIASLSFSLNSHISQWQAMFIGSKNTLLIDGNRLSLGNEELPVDTSLDPFTRQIREFADALLTGRTPIASGRDVLPTMWVLDEAARVASR